MAAAGARRPLPRRCLRLPTASCLGNASPQAVSRAHPQGGLARPKNLGTLTAGGLTTQGYASERDSLLLEEWMGATAVGRLPTLRLRHTASMLRASLIVVPSPPGAATKGFPCSDPRLGFRYADGPAPSRGAGPSWPWCGPAGQTPAAAFRASTRSVRSQVKSGSSRPKWPYAAVWE